MYLVGFLEHAQFNPSRTIMLWSLRDLRQKSPVRPNGSPEELQAESDDFLMMTDVRICVTV
jgi:hypothetical protein